MKLYQRCPICNGRGIVDGFFYGYHHTTSCSTQETCRRCSGTGTIETPPDDNFDPNIWIKVSDIKLRPMGTDG